MKFKLAAEPERMRTTIVSGMAVIFVLVATLYPFNPFPRNRVSWVKGTKGLNFDRPGLVLSNAPLRFAPASGQSYTLELFLCPTSVTSDSTILGFYSPHRTKQLLVRQNGDGLEITHDAGIDSDPTGTVDVNVERVFHPGVQVLIAISSGPNGTKVFIDEAQRAWFPKFAISQDEMSGDIVIGTSPVGYDPWQGQLRGAAIYVNELSAADALKRLSEWVEPKGKVPDLRNAIARYSFAEGVGVEVHNEVGVAPDLHIPTVFSVPDKSFLQSPAAEFKTNPTYLNDIVRNIAGFIPLGLILCAFFRWTQDRWNATFTAVIACGTLSLVIESLQYCIPGRESGVTDTITNTLGAAIGASLIQSGVVRRALQRLKLIPFVCTTGEESLIRILS